jgi:hypothetical protein
MSALERVSGGTLVLIDQLEADPSRVGEAETFGLVTRRLVSTTRESMSSLAELATSMEEAAKASRVLRQPTRKIVHEFQRLQWSLSAMDEWDRRLQALGVPVPPEDWEPPTEEADEPAPKGQQWGNTLHRCKPKPERRRRVVTPLQSRKTEAGRKTEGF